MCEQTTVDVIECARRGCLIQRFALIDVGRIAWQGRRGIADEWEEVLSWLYA